MRKSNRKAFTLIELLVVISIIAILAAMLIPVINQVRSLAYQTVCRSQLKQVMLAVVAYRNDNEGYYPMVATSWDFTWWWPAGSSRWQDLIEPFLGTYLTLNCPVSTRLQPSFKVVDEQTGWMPRGCAPAGFVCTTAINSLDWSRYPQDAAHSSYPNPGPFVEATAQAAMRAALPSARLERCPVVFDGAWKNEYWAQKDNWWGVYFPHRQFANMAFHDGHTESVRQFDVTSWEPLQVLDR